MHDIKINKDLVTRFVNDQCSEKEIDFFIEFVKLADSEEELKNTLWEIWQNSNEKNETYSTNFDLILQNIHHTIINHQIKESIFSHDNSNSKNITRKLVTTISKIAAILFIPLLIYSAFSLLKNTVSNKDDVVYSEMSTPSGTTTKLTLPDGTKVWLNGGSWIKYPLSFTSNIREVEFKGEGYFQVQHNPKNPFLVQTDDINIKVLGTSFNIENYDDQNEIITTLVEGKVEMQKVMQNNKIAILTNLKPNEQLVFDKKNKKGILFQDINTYKYTAWLEGKTVFENEPLDEVFTKLSRRYNVDIDFKEDELSKYSFTATLKNENFEQIIELIGFAVPIEYTIEDSIKNSDNSYTKKRYNINLRN